MIVRNQQQTRINFCAVFLVFLLGAVLPVSAVMTPAGTQQLTSDSQLIVLGRVTGVKSFWSNDRSIIFSRGDIRVEEVLKGTLDGKRLYVEFPGGEVNGTRMDISDRVYMAAGERVLLFLRSRSGYGDVSKNVYEPVAGPQGKYRIDKRGIAIKGGFSVVTHEEMDIPGPCLLDGTNSRSGGSEVAKIIDNHIPLSILTGKIKGDIPMNLSFAPSLYRTDTAAAKDISRPNYSYSARWGNPKIKMKVNTTGGPSIAMGAILAAMDEWSDINTSTLQFIYTGTTTVRSTGINGVNAVYFTSLGGNMLGYSQWWSNGSGIFETDIKLDSSTTYWSTYGVRGLVLVNLHEMGHSIGLNHVPSNSIMVVPITTAHRLFPDDFKAASDLYPVDDYTDCQFNSAADSKSDIFWRNNSTGMTYIWLMDGTTAYGSLTIGEISGSLSSSWKSEGHGDFDGDGDSDILWRHYGTGQVYVWLLDGVNNIGSISHGSISPSLSLEWRLICIGDFNADGKSDLLWRHAQTGGVYVWLMNGTANVGSISHGSIIDALDLNWKLKGTGHFDSGNTKTDLLWQNDSTGQVFVWLMDGTSDASTITSGSIIDALDTNWRLKGVGDFDNDGIDDILWQHAVNGQVVVWLLNGTTAVGSLTTGSICDFMILDWVIKGLADFNGDSKPDILWQNASTGGVYVWLLNGTTSIGSLTHGSIADALSSTWQFKGFGDFNADTKMDLLWRNTSSGSVYIWLMNGSTAIGSITHGNIYDLSDFNWKMQ